MRPRSNANSNTTTFRDRTRITRQGQIPRGHIALTLMLSATTLIGIAVMLYGNVNEKKLENICETQPDNTCPPDWKAQKERYYSYSKTAFFILIVSLAAELIHWFSSEIGTARTEGDEREQNEIRGSTTSMGR